MYAGYSGRELMRTLNANEVHGEAQKFDKFI